MSLQHFQGCHCHPTLHHQFCLNHFQGCRISPNRIRHLQPQPSTPRPQRPPRPTQLAPAMPASDAANDTKPSAPLPSTPPKKTRRMKPQLLVLPLAQYPIPASRKNATAPKLPRTLSITSVPRLPNPHRLIQSLHQSQLTIFYARPRLLDRQRRCQSKHRHSPGVSPAQTGRRQQTLA